MMTTNNNNTVPLSPIQQFFSGTTIFVTGATGFMGKCLLEKLLRCCSDLDKIYILVREKRGKKTSDRVDELFQDVLFTKLHSISDKLRSKVVAVSGDMSTPGLGLSLQDRAMLQQEVNVVFHAAATVNFNEKLRLAVAINVNGTKELLELCRGMGKLKSLVHVSTAYSNCHLTTVNEQFYKYPISYKDLIFLLESLDDKTLEDSTPRILGAWPNTYAFTKAMAESLVEDTCGGLPVSVFRPAVVVSTYKEPLQGWIDNVYGPTGICAGVLMGVLGSMWCDDRVKANIVPVDYTVNALIACAWETGRKERGKEGWETERKEKGKEGWESGTADTELEAMYQTPNLHYKPGNESTPTIFNYVSSVEKPITWGEYNGINMLFGLKHPPKDALWCISFNTTRSHTEHRIRMFFAHFIPAVLVDSLALLLAKKPRLIKIYKQTDKFSDIISYFSNRDWQFSNDNTQRLWRSLDKRDKELFQFSMGDMDWLEYFRTYVPGMRKYLCKDDDTSIPYAIQKQNRLHYASKCIKMIMYYGLVNFVIFIFKMIFKY